MIFTTLTKLLLARRSNYSKSVIYADELKAFLHYMHAPTAPPFSLFCCCCSITCMRALLLFPETKGSFDKLLFKASSSWECWSSKETKLLKEVSLLQLTCDPQPDPLCIQHRKRGESTQFNWKSKCLLNAENILMQLAMWIMVGWCGMRVRCRDCEDKRCNPTQFSQPDKVTDLQITHRRF